MSGTLVPIGRTPPSAEPAPYSHVGTCHCSEVDFWIASMAWIGGFDPELSWTPWLTARSQVTLFTGRSIDASGPNIRKFAALQPIPLPEACDSLRTVIHAVTGELHQVPRSVVAGTALHIGSFADSSVGLRSAPCEPGSELAKLGYGESTIEERAAAIARVVEADEAVFAPASLAPGGSKRLPAKVISGLFGSGGRRNIPERPLGFADLVANLGPHDLGSGQAFEDLSGDLTLSVASELLQPPIGETLRLEVKGVLAGELRAEETPFELRDAEDPLLLAIVESAKWTIELHGSGEIVWNGQDCCVASATLVLFTSLEIEALVREPRSSFDAAPVRCQADGLVSLRRCCRTCAEGAGCDFSVLEFGPAWRGSGAAKAR